MHTLEDALVDAYVRLPKKEIAEKSIQAEADLTLHDVNQRTVDVIGRMAPFGIDNPKPIFRFPKVTVRLIERFGKGKEHTRLHLIDERGDSATAIAFFTTPETYMDGTLAPGVCVHLYAQIETSRFMGRYEIRLRIVDIIPSFA